MTDLAEIGQTPYTDLAHEQRVWLAHATITQLAGIAEAATRQNPPNLTVLSAVSALLLRTCYEQGESPAAMLPLIMHEPVAEALDANRTA